MRIYGKLRYIRAFRMLIPMSILAVTVFLSLSLSFQSPYIFHSFCDHYSYTYKNLLFRYCGHLERFRPILRWLSLLLLFMSTNFIAVNDFRFISNSVHHISYYFCQMHCVCVCVCVYDVGNIVLRIKFRTRISSASYKRGGIDLRHNLPCPIINVTHKISLKNVS